MSEARLAASIVVSALIRRAEIHGGFAAVVAKGDPTAGTILLILLERGGNPQLFERILQPNGLYAWQVSSSQTVDNPEKFSQLIAQRRRFDPDLWVLELDIPSVERFAAEMNEFG